MSLGIDTLTATPTTIELGGRQLRLSPLTHADIGALQAWIHSQLPDPIAVAHRLAAGMPEAVQDKILNRAFDHAMAAKKTHMIGTEEADQYLASMDGFVQLLLLMCRGHQPDVTAGWIAPLVGSLDKERINAISMFAFGVTPRRVAAPAADGGANGQANGHTDGAAAGSPGDPKATGGPAAAPPAAPTTTPASIATSPEVMAGPPTSSTG